MSGEWRIEQMHDRMGMGIAEGANDEFSGCVRDQCGSYRARHADCGGRASGYAVHEYRWSNAGIGSFMGVCWRLTRAGRRSTIRRVSSRARGKQRGDCSATPGRPDHHTGLGGICRTARPRRIAPARTQRPRIVSDMSPAQPIMLCGNSLLTEQRHS